MEEQYGFEKVSVVLLLMLLASCAQGPRVIFDNGVAFNVEIARTLSEHEKGLMFRESLPTDAGMLFVFEDNRPRDFWMKNTKIPLDMVYVDANLSVVEVKANVPPCTTDPCPVYESLPASFVLEVNAGAAKENGIAPGVKMGLRE